ncbi:hypothetical protein BD779DRAFT_1789325 [Infundibulicybe gibba]|nr:hypothetical protein BD779DRAFT_1789325 [Infundibulicybe gibba]
MSGELLYIVDDASNTMALSGGQWATSEGKTWYNGSLIWPGFAIMGNKAIETGVYGSLSYTFHGTSIAFVGNTHRSNNSRITLVTIDGNSPYNTSYDNPISQNYQQWYQSPHLDDGVHTIQMDNIAAPSVDIVVISAGPNTPLSGQTVIVDDDDPSIIYSGNWKRNSSSFITSDDAGGLPFHNGTHQSTTPGDTASIHFTGNSVAVYGIYSWVTLGSMSVTYTLDNSSSTKTYKVTPSSPDFVNKEFQQQNFQFFSEDSLAPGNHTLSINITEIDNMIFVMDYLTYSPSFNFLTTKSNITGTPTTPAPSTSPSTSLLTNSSSSTSTPSKSEPSKNGVVGGIVGGVAGAIVALVFAFFIVYKRGRGNLAFLREAGLKSGRHRSVVEPYLLTVRPTGADATSPVPESRDELKHPLDSSLTTSNPQRLIANPQDTQERIRVVEALIAELEMTPDNDRASHDNQARINRLRQRIDELTQESLHSNAGDPPPAYGASTR